MRFKWLYGLLLCLLLAGSTLAQDDTFVYGSPIELTDGDEVTIDLSEYAEASGTSLAMSLDFSQAGEKVVFKLIIQSNAIKDFTYEYTLLGAGGSFIYSFADESGNFMPTGISNGWRLSAPGAPYEFYINGSRREHILSVEKVDEDAIIEGVILSADISGDGWILVENPRPMSSDENYVEKTIDAEGGRLDLTCRGVQAGVTYPPGAVEEPISARVGCSTSTQTAEAQEVLEEKFSTTAGEPVVLSSLSLQPPMVFPGGPEYWPLVRFPVSVQYSSISLDDLVLFAYPPGELGQMKQISRKDYEVEDFGCEDASCILSVRMREFVSVYMPVIYVDDDGDQVPLPDDDARSEQKFTLGLSLPTLSYPYFVALRDGAEAAADSLGAELVIVEAQDDPAIQAANMEDLIALGVDAIMVHPTDADAIIPSIEAANEAGIPVFTIDRAANGGEVVSHIAPDNVGGGRMAAEFLCNALGGEGDVVELEGIPGSSVARDRGAGFNQYMEEECSGVTIVSRQTASFNRAEGFEVFEDILMAEPDTVGVFAHNDEMILGAIDAAKAAGLAGEIVFVGFDAIDDAVVAVEVGLLAATVAYQPALIGELGVETASKYLSGQEVEEYIPVDFKLVTSGE